MPVFAKGFGNFQKLIKNLQYLNTGTYLILKNSNFGYLKLKVTDISDLIEIYKVMNYKESIKKKLGYFGARNKCTRKQSKYAKRVFKLKN